MHISDAAVVVHLHFRLKPGCRPAYLSYIHEAFPVFEAQVDCKGVVYTDASDPEAIDEVFYYRSVREQAEADRRLREEPSHIELVKRWRELIDGEPRVEVLRRILPPAP